MLTVDIEKLVIAPGQTCLDVGCGEGRHTLAVYLLDGVLSIGVDVSERDLATAKGRVVDMRPHAPGGAVGFAAGDATALPMADETIDVVIASEILEHIYNYLSVLEEAMRVLKPGGRLCVSVPRQWPEWVCWQLSEGYRKTPGGHIRIFDSTHLRREIEQQGFTYVGGGSAHALHVPYWWLKCLFWQREQEPRVVRAYHKLLVWDLMRRPWLTRMFDAVFNPILGKSIVLYFVKPLPDGATSQGAVT
ncbi:MAG: SAM-dependent methyltransferase [Halieaceae bacterium]|nr:SAM-dependent methyltransferase [Halieaceae bacterium]